MINFNITDIFVSFSARITVWPKT